MYYSSNQLIFRHRSQEEYKNCDKKSHKIQLILYKKI